METSADCLPRVPLAVESAMMPHCFSPRCPMAETNTDSNAAPPVIWIKDNSALASACQTWQTLHAIGVDTEFVRTRTYFAKLGLIQVGGDGQCWLIDPLEISDWAPFSALLADPDTTKIIHSGSEDIEIFQRLGEQPLAGFFDTQVAAALSGMGSSLSYQALVLDQCGTEIEKDVTRSDWVARPLSEAQIRYAALDVAHLHELHHKLSEKLTSLERMDWLISDCDQSVARTTLEQHLEIQYQRFKQVWRLDGPQRSAIAGLIRWRELTAREKDRPRSHIITDNDLLTLARELPLQRDAMLALTLEHPRSVSRWASAIMTTLGDAAAATDHPAAQPEPLDRSAKALVSNLRSQISDLAEQLDLAPEVLCGKRELLHLLQVGSPSPKLAGWRFELLSPMVAEHLP